MPPIKTANSNLTLTYDATDILGENDKSLFLHRRPLLNADTMVKKGLFKSALEIYYRAVSKISNPEIQKKIQKNISDIHAYLKNTDPESEKVFLEKYSDNKEKEKEFNDSLKELTENLSDSLAEKLNILKQIETVPEKNKDSHSSSQDSTESSSQIKDESEIKPLDLGSLDTKNKTKQKKEIEQEEEQEEIEGILEYEEQPNLDQNEAQLTEKSETNQTKPKKKKPKKANIKVPKEPEPGVTNLTSDSTEIKSDSTQIENESTEVISDSTQIENESTEVISDSTQIENESTEVNSGSTKIENESAEVISDSTEIENESAEFTGNTVIQNATIDSDAIQIENKKTLTSAEINKEQDSKQTTPNLNDQEIRLDETKATPHNIESKITEEIKNVKEYTEKIDSPLTNLESDVNKPDDSFIQSESILKKSSVKKSSSSQESNFGDIETGWSELETEPPKPKADKDYAPQMKKYEAGNIEIPESTEFISGEFISKDSEGNFESHGKSNYGGGISPEMLKGLPSTSEGKNFDIGKEAFNPPPLPPPLPLNINDWLSNLYFSKEWEKFKPLPMKERRSGKDRRTSTTNALPKGVKKDRRSGLDRRKHEVNLLQERENFLNDWNKNNQNYSPQLSQMLGNASLPQTGLPGQEEKNLFTSEQDPNLKTMEFLPRDPGSHEKIPSAEDLIKVELPDPEEVILKPPLDQNQEKKEEIAGNIAESLSKYVPANEELGLPESDKGLVKIDLPDPVFLKAEANELPQREVSGEIEVSSKDGTGIVGDAANREKSQDPSRPGSTPYTPEAYSIPEELKIELPDPDDFVRTKTGHLIDPFAPEETPEINMIEGDGPLPSEEEGPEISEIPELPPPPPEPERTIHGILELKPPEIDDAPFLTLTYDFSKIPHPFKLSKNYSIMEYSYYKYKPMLMKAQEFARRKMLKNALNYYRVIKSQNIPPELKNMINRNITDITEFLEKFIMSKGGG